MKQPYRQLRGYSLDPTFSTRLDTEGINEITYQVRWEENLKKGPIGDYFEVIDFDPASNCFYDPVHLDAPDVLRQSGITPSEGNPKFHQQFVYTIAMKTLEHFEHSLGRKIIWPPRQYVKERKGDTEWEYVWEYVDKLRIHPHALRDANAYYDPEKKAVLFGYFEAAQNVGGINFPGGVIFTALSPDIIAHEMTHAILDSIHPRFIENTNPDVPAFHEGFADIVALLQRFTIPSLVEHQIAQTRGNLEEFSFLGELATQFGNALDGNRGALRGAIGKMEKGKWKRYKPNPEDYRTIYEPHDRGAILVAAVFDAFIRLYNNTTADLLRIATNGSGVLQAGAIHPDLVKRLAQEACELAERLLHVCIRALDYCPPHDITFGDFLRALITADLDSSNKDVKGYKVALIEAFRSWGIYPERVNTLSVDSLQWSKPVTMTDEDKRSWRIIATTLRDDIRLIVDNSYASANNREKIHEQSLKVQAKLHGLLMSKREGANWSSLLEQLGLTDRVLSFEYEGQTVTTHEVPDLEVHRVRPVFRVGRDGKINDQVLITLTQTMRFSQDSLDGLVFRGGCTILLNMSQDCDVEYVISKNVNSQYRFQQQMDYQLGKTASYTALNKSLYDDDGGGDINFAHLHFH